MFRCPIKKEIPFGHVWTDIFFSVPFWPSLILLGIAASPPLPLRLCRRRLEAADKEQPCFSVAWESHSPCPRHAEEVSGSQQRARLVFTRKVACLAAGRGLRAAEITFQEVPVEILPLCWEDVGSAQIPEPSEENNPVHEALEMKKN